MNFEDIKVDIENQSILVITINRSNVFNALRTNTLKEIASVLTTCSDEIRCVILTGGEKVFAAGADINELDVKGALE
jgi:enoyl-CoA hydratase